MVNLLRAGGCEEASPASTDSYIPCNREVEELIYCDKDGRHYAMCAMCADHSVNNRGMTLVGSISISGALRK